MTGAAGNTGINPQNALQSTVRHAIKQPSRGRRWGRQLAAFTKMRQMAHGLRNSLLGLAVLAASGCSNGGMISSLGLPQVSLGLPGLPQMPELPAAKDFTSTSPTEIYALVARGVRSCWFGPGGVLKQTHVFHANAAPPSSGGQAEIVLHERDATLHLARGARAYRIDISSEGAGARIEHTNHKLAHALVVAVETDVHRFASGDVSCAVAGATALRPEADPDIAASPREIKSRQSQRSG